MKFISEVEIDDEILGVLLDYRKGYTLDSDYFISTGKESIEDSCYPYIEGGFYQHYPLQPTYLGDLILELYEKRKDGK